MKNQTTEDIVKLKIMENTELMNLTDDIQKECHMTIDYKIGKGNSKITYQDATNVFLFKKLAELQIQINSLKESS